MADERDRLSNATFYAIAVIVAALCLAVGYVWGRYGGATFLPGLVATLAGTLVAFVLALAWDRERDRRQYVKEESDLNEQRTTEVRRRFAPVLAELKKNKKSIDGLVDEYKSLPIRHEGRVPMLNPPLLEGAWVANASRLSELVADYELVSDLATTYGKIEELRWRLRLRSEHRAWPTLTSTP